MTSKACLKLFVPPLLVQGYRFLRGRKGNSVVYGLSGDYHSWDEAVRASTGYDSEIILEKTKEALLKVKNGQAVYERDSVVFDETQYAWSLCAGLLWIAAQSGVYVAPRTLVADKRLRASWPVRVSQSLIVSPLSQASWVPSGLNLRQ